MDQQKAEKLLGELIAALVNQICADDDARKLARTLLGSK